MKKLSVFVLFFCLCIPGFTQNVQPVIVIHGGAGVISQELIKPEREKACHEQMQKALQAGMEVLKKGGTSLDAVETVVRMMEDSPLFNAGKGAVFNFEGKNELDAAIMDGKTLKAGAVAGLSVVKNPVSLARAVMEKSPHVMMISKGAEQFAREKGVEIVDPSYFRTEERWQQWKEMKEAEKKKKSGSIWDDAKFKSARYGTVGCVALDQYGNLAAATSTGGMSNKRYNRVGDVPVIGAGTYANNQSCAVSATGWGEFFIRSVVGHDIAALVEYKNLPVKEAGETVLKKVADLGGDGGVIILDKSGNFAMPFNSEGMYRGYLKADGKMETMIFK
jgi:L-asparaginase / beta-aspartyl-peptidase